MSSRRLPDGYLELCSLDALESLLLARMNQAANLCAQAKQMLQLWVEVEAEVKVAQWMLDRRRSHQLRAGAAAQLQVAHAYLAPLQPKVLPAFSAPLHETVTLALLSKSPSSQRASSRLEQERVPNVAAANRLCQRRPAMAIHSICGERTGRNGVAKLPGLNRSPGCIRAEYSLARGPSKTQLGADGRRLPTAS